VNRRIVTAEDVAAGVDRVPDGYFDRVLKCIPVEVVSVYVVLASAAVSAFDGGTLRWWLFLLLAGGALAAPTYARSALGIRRASQLLMTTVAFVAIVAVTGGWFGTLSWWTGFYPLLGTVLFGIAVALLGFGPARPRPLPPPAAREPAEEVEPAADPEGDPDDTDSELLRVWRGAEPPRP
jgi:hypothetical protein